MDKDNIQEGVADQKLKEFWGQFRLFPSSLENYIFSRTLPVLVLAALPYVLYLSTGVIADLIKNEGWDLAYIALTEWQEITAVISLALIGTAYLHWQGHVPGFFQWLFDTGRLVSTGPDLEAEYLGFLKNYQRQLHSGIKRYSFSILLMLLAIIANLVVGIPQRIYRFLQYGDFDSIAWAICLFFIWIFGFLLWTWFVGLAAWPAFVTGRQISGLRQKFGISVQPSHPDRCGGLQQMGDFCFSMALPIVVGGLIVVFFIFAGTVFQDVSIGVVHFGSIMDETVLFMNLILFLVFFLSSQ